MKHFEISQICQNKMKTFSQNHKHKIMKTSSSGTRRMAGGAPVSDSARTIRTDTPGRRPQLQRIGMILCAMILCSLRAFAEEQTGTYRLIGLSAPEREADLREVMKAVPDVALVSLDAAKAEVTLRYELEKLFPTAKPKQPPAPEKITERISSLIGQASKNTFTVTAPSTVPADKLTKVEIPIGVLDCKACRYAAYQAVAKVDGVERATVSATPSAVIAWIDATKTKREALEEALKKARVELLNK